MTAGDMIKPTLPDRHDLIRQRTRRGHAPESARSGNYQAVVLFVILTVVWVAVLWLAIFGSRPHTYLLLLVGTYTVGVLSGTGLSGFIFRRARITQQASKADEPIDAKVRTVS